MSYQEKRSVTTMLSAIILLSSYCMYIFNHVKSNAYNNNDLKGLAISMLVFIGIGIIAIIIIQIIFHIFLSIQIAAKEFIENDRNKNEIDKTIKANMVEDEMDHLIDLKASRISTILFSFGFFLALISLICNYSAYVMLNIFFISWLLSMIFENIIRIYFYRKGVKNA